MYPIDGEESSLWSKNCRHSVRRKTLPQSPPLVNSDAARAVKSISLQPGSIRHRRWRPVCSAAYVLVPRLSDLDVPQFSQLAEAGIQSSSTKINGRVDPLVHDIPSDQNRSRRRHWRRGASSIIVLGNEPPRNGAASIGGRRCYPAQSSGPSGMEWTRQFASSRVGPV